MLEDNGKAYLTSDDYQRISTVLLYYIINLQDLCVSTAASLSSSPPLPSFASYQFYLLALTSLHPGEDSRFLSASETESILQLINQHYQPSTQDTSSDLQVRVFLVLQFHPVLIVALQHTTISRLILQCLDATGLLQDVKIQENPGADTSSVPKLAAAIITHILQGHCFRRWNLPSPAFFTDYIFQSLNCTSNLQIMGRFKSIVAFSNT